MRALACARARSHRRALEKPSDNVRGLSGVCPGFVYFLFDCLKLFRILRDKIASPFSNARTPDANLAGHYYFILVSSLAYEQPTKGPQPYLPSFLFGF